MSYLMKKGVPSAIGFRTVRGPEKGILSVRHYPHKCAEAGALIRDLLGTDNTLYRCTRPALQHVVFNGLGYLIALSCMIF
jgi:hypothetical protein